MTTMDDSPADLAPPLAQPAPTPGCGVCEALVRQRATARAKGDFSSAGDCNVEILNHTHQPQRGKRT
ncbi:hypothetical protein [Streptomyces sp. NPDC005485]|uniref:hypothetical protein n=1 Tax=Streptomyces sp. NPDC005485 TaxID=3155591 RepID=UPI0033ADF57A